MPLPRPTPGLVIHHEYLWQNEFMAGANQGIKRRPVAIILAVAARTGGIEVVVAPITHTEPTGSATGVLLPPRVKKHLGLDDNPSWVITNDLNVFEWPGEDLYPVPQSPPGTYEYGFLPPALFQQIRDDIVKQGVLPTPR
jgi:hypothetical protein